MTDDQLKILYGVAEEVKMLKDFSVKNGQWQETHDRKSDEWRSALDARMIKIESFFESVNWVYKFLLGLAALIAMLLKAWDKIRDHWK